MEDLAIAANDSLVPTLLVVLFNDFPTLAPEPAKKALRHRKSARFNKGGAVYVNSFTKSLEKGSVL
jgi:hypothetical protein